MNLAKAQCNKNFKKEQAEIIDKKTVLIIKVLTDTGTPIMGYLTIIQHKISHKEYVGFQYFSFLSTVLDLINRPSARQVPTA